MVTAKIGRNTVGTFGIRWEDHPWVSRGDYSGPFQTEEEAEQAAKDWAAAYDESLTVEKVERI